MQIGPLNTHMHDHSLCWLGTGTSWTKSHSKWNDSVLFSQNTNSQM